MGILIETPLSASITNTLETGEEMENNKQIEAGIGTQGSQGCYSAAAY